MSKPYQSLALRLKPAKRLAGAVLTSVIFLHGCGSSESELQNDVTPPDSPPADTYFSLAVTENSHNHSGARLLFLDFQGSTPSRAMIQNNVVIAPRIDRGAITLEGDAGEWDSANLTIVPGLVQNNYPLSEFVDAVPTDVTVGSAWDEDYVYFLVQWRDAGHTASTKFQKWIYGDQGGGESGWNSQVHAGVAAGAPNEGAVNAQHVLAGSESEDRVLMMFPITDSEGNFSDGGLGCAAYCHANLADDNPWQNYTGTGVAAMHTNVDGDRADIWHWKSSRTAPSLPRLPWRHPTASPPNRLADAIRRSFRAWSTWLRMRSISPRAA